MLNCSSVFWLWAKKSKSLAVPQSNGLDCWTGLLTTVL